MKTCSHCNQHLPLDCFYHSRKRNVADTEWVKAGLSANCKQCNAWNHRRRRYNLTVDELKDLEQRTNCDICGFAYERALDQCIDHDHATGTVRGVVCRKCNLGLGHFDDDAARLREAANYIEEER